MSALDLSNKTLALQSGRKTRTQQLVMIRVIARDRGETAALKYWLDECPRISRAAANQAMR
ncbi:hypothetical protein OpiT1DRAFT_03859 [Opitutaceae bacterium TAV1]|nr:hypothetical protein OpiT1DRAFT_03859 [Opitutaceae bacterium TAV1]